MKEKILILPGYLLSVGQEIGLAIRTALNILFGTNMHSCSHASLAAAKACGGTITCVSALDQPSAWGNSSTQNPAFSRSFIATPKNCILLLERDLGCDFLVRHIDGIELLRFGD